MKKSDLVVRHFDLGLAVGIIAMVFVGCTGSGGGAEPAAAQASAPAIAPPSGMPAATALNMTITNVSINANHAPVVSFTVTNETGARFPGLQPGSLRFNVAKLSPGMDGTSGGWQNYVNTTGTNTTNATIEMRGNLETPSLLAQDGAADAMNSGALIDHGDGTYAYTFQIDLTDTQRTCPAPCIDAQKNPLDTSFQPSFTHRVGIYIRQPLPPANATYDFRPDGNAVTYQRNVVTTAKCNGCHEQLNHHLGRTDTKLCVTCHNPGTWDGKSGNTADFRVMIHKIHSGQNLPSVLAGGKYAFPLLDFTHATYPQEIRNCTTCHDGTAGVPNSTPHGDYWKTNPSVEACGSCHDNIDFTKDGSATFATTPIAQRTGHSGGVVAHLNAAGGVAAADNSLCVTCHASGKVAGSVQANHNIDAATNQFAATAQRAKFKFNILKICGKAVASNPVCPAGTTPTVTFSVTDPTGGTHGYPNGAYNIFSDPEFWNATAKLPTGNINIDLGWGDATEISNVGGYGARPGRASQINVFGATANTANYGSAATPPYARAADNGDGTYTATALGPIPDGTTFPNIAATGSGVIGIEGRAFGPPLTTIPATTDGLQLRIKGAVAYFGITDSKPVPRRVTVDAAKCNNCHDQVSMHVGLANDNLQLCTICHNANSTDVRGAARHKFANGLSDGTVTARTPAYAYDGKKEEAVDFKHLMHALHAGATNSLDGTTKLRGMREKGLVANGKDNSEVIYPGLLGDCTSCHVNGSYRLTGAWEAPSQHGIQGTTFDSTPGLTSTHTAAQVNASLQDPADNLKISPTAAVCSSCHDTTLAKAHMKLNGGVFGDQGAPSTQASLLGVIETCAVCHRPGAISDVDIVHSIPH